MNLHIDVAGDTALIPVAEQAWAAFETSFALPFAYDIPAIFGVCDDTAVSALAESMLREGVATIRVTHHLLNAPLIERNLTLLHESLHVASFSGTLPDMYAATTRFEETYVRQTLHRMLSPKWKNFDDLSQWGAATYEAVVRLVSEKAFRLESL